MKRLTDKRTAEALKRNAEGLMSKGFDVPIDDLRYIKLADYENIVERLEREHNQENGGKRKSTITPVYAVASRSQRDGRFARSVKRRVREWEFYHR